MPFKQRLTPRNFKSAHLMFLISMAFGNSFPASCIAASQVVYDTTISAVTVNGGADTANPGTTCIQVATSLPAACASGFIAIPNNNRQLITAALLTKTTSSKATIYYEDAASAHCPGFTYTSCAIISIQTK